MRKNKQIGDKENGMRSGEKRIRRRGGGGGGEKKEEKRTRTKMRRRSETDRPTYSTAAVH